MTLKHHHHTHTIANGNTSNVLYEINEENKPGQHCQCRHVYIVEVESRHWNPCFSELKSCYMNKWHLRNHPYTTANRQNFQCFLSN